MEWVQAHWDELLAVIGALYVVARLIVALTPTPKDNEAVDKIGSFLKTVGLLFGLDIKQGIHTSGSSNVGDTTKAGGGNPPIAPMLFLLLLPCVLLAGCNGPIVGNPRGEVLVAMRALAATETSLATISDKFTESEKVQIKIADEAAYKTVVQWREAVVAGVEAPTLATAFYNYLYELIAYEESKGVGL